ncbi:Probable GTP-binding protein EngB [Buchnera aphidicola (Tetraneura ulmi)]|uniref:ribosome biogenesis GTP-binding protein YihA/YsxC n=1 Tax=Buchnera aphidicola TaxID=9 RepID=UPI003463D84B
MFKKYQNTIFLTSVVNVGKKYLFKYGKEVAFLGFSNSGKSSLINFLSNKNFLSRTSNKLGCTKSINFFEIFSGYRLVDLPGYGYSKLSKKDKKNINNLIRIYLKHSTCLVGVLLIVDIRRLLRDLDFLMINYLINNKKRFFIILTKSDKLKKCLLNKQLLILKKQISCFFYKIDIVIISTKKKENIKELKKRINNFFLNNIAKLK